MLLYCKSNPYTGLDRPLGPQEVEAFRIARHSVHEGGKFVSLCTGHLYSPGDTPGTHFVRG